MSAAGGSADDSLRGLYDERTRQAIDDWLPGRGHQPSGPVTAGGWRGGVAAGAVVAAGLAGVREAVESGDEPEIGEVLPEPLGSPDQAVTVLFVPGDPEGTVAVVRPWLLRFPPGPAIARLAG